MKDNILLSDFEADLINERIGKLKGGLCILKAGGISAVEIQETRDRLEDSLFAVKAALSDGYVVGAGVALVMASQKLDISVKGSEIVQKACQEPFLKIIQNATNDH